MKTDTEYQLKFIHPEHGELIFSSEMNNLNMSTMFWFSNSNKMNSGTLHSVKTIVKNIRIKHTDIISDDFDFIK
jgi:hypothetical protein